MILIKERIGKMLEYLQEQVYPIPHPGQKLRTRNCGVDTENITGLRP